MNFKNIVVFVNNISVIGLEDIRKIKNSKKIKIAVIGPARQRGWIEKSKQAGVDYVLPVDYTKKYSIDKALLPISDKLLAMTCRNDKSAFDFAKIIPHVPYLKTPSTHSLYLASDKLLMREYFNIYDASISPKYVLVSNFEEDNIKKVIKKSVSEMSFPMIVKPTNLHSSLLVFKCKTKVELEESLKIIFQKIEIVYKQNKIKQKPKILVEEFMEGGKYSVDAYVDSRGGMDFCPFVYNRTGREIGFDDFFEFELSNRPVLTKEERQAGLKVARKAVHALGLRSTSAHIELIKTKQGWKVIEVGARIGGFRHKLYKLTHSISHAANDVRIRIYQKPILPKVRKKYAGVFNFYPRQEGRLDSIKGLNKIKQLKSFVELKQYKQKGDMCRFAKHGGTRVLSIWLAHKDLKQWKADVKTMEGLVEVIAK